MSGNAGWSVGGGRLSAIGLVGLFVLASMITLLGSAEVSADPAARHIYTFSDGVYECYCSRISWLSCP